MTSHAFELAPDDLSYTCDPDLFEFETTNDLPDLPTIIGQARAVRAIDFGVQIPSYGFNVYVMGPAGTGRSTTVQRFLEPKAEKEAIPDDWCYVYNFADPRRPRAIRLPAGKANELRGDMDELVRDLKRVIPTVFDSDDYNQRSGAIVQEMEQARTEILKQLDAQANQHEFALVQTATGLGLAPKLKGQVLTPEQFQELPDDVKSKFEAQHQDLQQDLAQAMREIRALEKSTKERIRSLAHETADIVVKNHIDDLEKKYVDFAEVVTYLGEVHSDVVEHVADFRPLPEPDENKGPLSISQQLEDALLRYKVNVIVDHSQSQGAPIIYETNPTYSNLVGRIEQEARFGVLTTNFTQIRAGSLHRANGGYLVINARNLLEYPMAWDALERTVKNQEIRTEVVPEAIPVAITTSLEPECIPFHAKVILIGDWSTYSLLYNLDDDFRKVFKVRADFGSRMKRTDQAIKEYARFVASRVRADGLLPFDRSAVARIVEVGTYLVEDKDKLSTRFAQVVEVVQEASYWAGRNGHQIVTADDVDRTMQERRYRAAHVQEQLQERILEGTIRIETEGREIGQVNGLSVLEVADYEFGIPSRISARTYMGKGGVVAIDREANLAGNLHNKGVLILQGYIGGKYAGKKALSLSASLTFEQNYDRIDGDSASSAELYALLSSLSRLPVRQDLSVTGSVDQQGRVQAIGGVIAKIEGFFDICRERGLTGTQGVLIPAANVRHLVLRDDVVEAVREGKFHVYAVETIDQGIELLTGVPAGEIDDEGGYPDDSVNYLVQQRLLVMAESKDGLESTDDENEKEPDSLLADDAPAETEA